MNIHLMPYEKVINEFITNCEKVNKKKTRYIIYNRSTNSNVGNIVSHALAEFLDFKSDEFTNLIRSLNGQSRLYIHYLSNEMIRLLNSGYINKDIEVYWFLWQGDVYNRLMTNEEIYGDETLYFLTEAKKNESEHKFQIKNLHRYLKNYIVQRFKLKNIGYQEINKKTLKNALERVNYVICSCDKDVEFVRNKVPSFKAKHLRFQYYLNFKGFNNSPIQVNSKNILIGHSAAETNNHLDAYTLLDEESDKEFIQNSNIYSPLSYGTKNEHYINMIIEHGHTILGESFKPMTNFIKKEKYLGFLQTIDLALFYHKRPMAFGNILYLLANGTKIFVYPNPNFHFFINKGVTLYSIHEYKNQYRSPLNNQQKRQNRQFVEEFTSVKKNLQNLSKIVNA